MTNIAGAILEVRPDLDQPFDEVAVCLNPREAVRQRLLGMTVVEPCTVAWWEVVLRAFPGARVEKITDLRSVKRNG